MLIQPNIVKVADIALLMNEIAPEWLAEDFDNVGLMAGDKNAPVEKIAVALDLDHNAAKFVLKNGCDMIITHHPPIFNPLKSVDYTSALGRLITKGIAVYSAHTNFDCTVGGTDDALAEIAGIKKSSVIDYKYETLSKIVVYGQSSEIKDALLNNGGIDIYNENGCCSAVFGRNKLEAAMACIEDLRRKYGFRYYTQEIKKRTKYGIGRTGEIEKTSIAEMKKRMESLLGCSVVCTGDGDRYISEIATCAGAGGCVADKVIKNGTELFITGEVNYHTSLEMKSRGVDVMLCSHQASEWPGIQLLKNALQKRLKGVEYKVEVVSVPWVPLFV